MKRLLAVLALLAAADLLASAAAAVGRTSPAEDGPSADLAPILTRAAQYVLEYEQRFHDIVAEEVYDQTGPRDSRRQIGGVPLRCGVSFCRRTTRADVVFVRLAGDIPWGTFRDVYEVDGERIRDREARIERLFRDTPQAAVERARSLLAESAKYNIGPAARTLNFPTLPLPFLLEKNQGRFAWKRKGERRIADVRGVEVEFKETSRPTFVSDGDNGEQLAARGRFAIDPERGTVMRSEVCFRWEPERAEACLVTEYRPEPSLAMWVPTEMRERYGDLPYGSTMVFGAMSEATARYSGYRRFSVTVQQENVTPQPKQ
jgi:hypothetical protein